MNIEEARVKVRELWVKKLSREDTQAYVGTMSLDGEETALRQYVDQLWQAEAPDGSDYNLTDLGNAEHMAGKYRGNIRYSWERCRWLIWGGKHWEWDDGNGIIERAIETVRSIYSGAADSLDKDIRKAIGKHAARSESDSRIQVMVSLARALPGIPVKLCEFDAHPWLFNVNNGTINLKTGHLQPHNSEELHTVLVPVDYDPNAKCPQWDGFLDRVTDGRQTVSKYLQRAVGYSLTEDTRLQVFFFLYGVGNNGKSTFIMTVRKMLGAYGTKLSIEDLMSRDKKISGAPREGIADLRGKRFVFASEIEQGRRLAVGLIMDLTGGETVKVRRMYEHEFEYLPTYKVWISGNHKPTITDTTLSIWRRLKLIPFTITIPPEEIDVDLLSKLEMELPRILAWAVRGCIEYQAHGLQDATEVRKATASYRHDEDVLADFLEDYVLQAGKSDWFITKAAMKTQYQAWAQENGIEPLGQKNFKTRLTEKGVGDGFTPDKKHRAWTGIRVRTPADAPQNGGQDGQNDPENDAEGQNRQDSPESLHVRENQGEFMAKPVNSVPKRDLVQNEEQWTKV
jgi:putative DNA primase/helicase